MLLKSIVVEVLRARRCAWVWLGRSYLLEVIGDLRDLLFYLIVVLVDLLLEVMLQLSFALQENFLPQESL